MKYKTTPEQTRQFLKVEFFTRPESDQQKNKPIAKIPKQTNDDKYFVHVTISFDA